jgi:tetratricopeptide (TPR) repeat protein
MDALVAFNILGLRGFAPITNLWFLYALILLLLFIVSVAWATRDAYRSGLSPLYAAVVIVFTIWPLSIVWWIIVRNVSKGHSVLHRFGQWLVHALVAILFFFNLIFLWNSVWQYDAVSVAVTDKASLDRAFTRQDLTSELRYLKLAAEADSPFAQVLLGLGHYEGLGLPQDPVEAENWFRKIEDKGEPKIMYYLGRFFESGEEGVTKNINMAERWYRNAAEKGFVEAMLRLGELYYFGDGLPKDYERALLWLRKVADQGHAGAMFLVGFMYAEGQGTKPDDQTAEEWFRKSIQHAPDNDRPHYRLAKLLYDRDDYTNALKHAQRAVELSPEDHDYQALLGDIQSSLAYHGENICPDFVAVDTAIEIFRSIIESGTADTEMHWDLSWAYLQRGDFYSALSEATKAHQREPATDRYHWEVALIALHQGDMSTALKKLEFFDDSADVIPLFLQQNLGIARLAAGDYKKALQHFQQAHRAFEENELSSSQFFTVLHEIFALQQIGDTEQATSKLQDLSTAASTPWEVLLARFHNNLISETDLIQAATTNCMRCEAFFYIGRRHQAEGDIAAARRFFQQAVDMKAFTYVEHGLAAAMLSRIEPP